MRTTASARSLRRTLTCTVAGLAMAALLGPCASASPIVMQVVATDTGKGGNIKFVVDGTTVTDFAGAIWIKLDGVSYEAFCADVYTSIGIETISVNPYSPFTVNNAARAAWLYATQFSGVTTVTAGEAFQLAVWDIIHDGGDGFTSGHIRASTSVGTPSAVLTAANQYLTISAGQTSGEASLYISVDGPSAKQTLLSVYLGVGMWIETPEPSGFGLAGLAMAGMAFFGRRRLRRSSV